MVPIYWLRALSATRRREITPRTSCMLANLRSLALGDTPPMANFATTACHSRERAWLSRIRLVSPGRQTVLKANMRKTLKCHAGTGLGLVFSQHVELGVHVCFLLLVRRMTSPLSQPERSLQ